jgi:hypothetical protein
MDDLEAKAVMRLALGRIFRLLSRPAQPGDVAVYEQARAMALNAAEVLGHAAGGVPVPASVRLYNDRRGLNLYND